MARPAALAAPDVLIRPRRDRHVGEFRIGPDHDGSTGRKLRRTHLHQRRRLVGPEQAADAACQKFGRSTPPRSWRRRAPDGHHYDSGNRRPQRDVVTGDGPYRRPCLDNRGHFPMERSPVGKLANGTTSWRCKTVVSLPRFAGIATRHDGGGQAGQREGSRAAQAAGIGANRRERTRTGQYRR